jgi:hypothetical protein
MLAIAVRASAKGLPKAPGSASEGRVEAEGGGQTADVSKAVERADKLDRSRAKVERAEKAYRDAIGRLRDARATTRSRALSVADPEVATSLLEVAYHAAKRGIRQIEAFIAELRLQTALRDIDFDNLSAADREFLENALRKGLSRVADESFVKKPTPEVYALIEKYLTTLDELRTAVQRRNDAARDAAKAKLDQIENTAVEKHLKEGDPLRRLFEHIENLIEARSTVERSSKTPGELYFPVEEPPGVARTSRPFGDRSRSHARDSGSAGGSRTPASSASSAGRRRRQVSTPKGACA